MAIDHGRVVLAGCVPDRSTNLFYALQHLEAEHFQQDPALKIMYQLLGRYFDLTAGIMPRDSFEDMLESRNVEPSKILLYSTLFDDILAMSPSVSDHEFKYSVDRLKDLRSKQLTGEAITAGFEILEKGLEVNKEPLQGHKDAREFLIREITTIDRLNHMDASPEGDMRDETVHLLQDYADRKSGKISKGLYTGISQIDSITSGFQPGELVLICAYTGEGKSHFSTQIAHNAFVEQGKNVFFATSETIRPQVMRRLAARHSRMPQFNCPEGLNSKDLKNGTLTDAHEKVYQDVLDDLKNNPTYGHIYVAQIPRGATLAYIEARAKRVSQQWRIDLIVDDYLALLRAEIKRQSEREEKNEILKDAKVLATTSNDGEGLVLVSPWAMSQAAFKVARDTGGHYVLANLADTSEAEKSPDGIISMYRSPQTPNEVLMQMLKNRDGELPPPWLLEVDYRNSYLGPKTDDTADLLTSSGFGSSALDQFL